jgi:hypothetical protein
MGERAERQTERLARLFGPEAVWRLRAGGAVADVTVPGDEFRYISAAVTLPAGVRAAPLFGEGNRHLRLLPPPYDPDRGRDAAQPSSVAVVIDRGPRADARTLSLPALEEIATAYLKSLYPDFARGAPGYYCLLGDPVPVSVVAHEHLEPALPAWTPDPALARDPPRAILAVIDDGLPFAHQALRDQDGAKTRVEFCWLQGTAPARRHAAGGGPNWGREYLRDEIDALIAAHGGDEDKLYHAAGVATPRYEYGTTIARFGTHGSHVLAAAGGGSGTAESRRIRMIAVQLAPAVTLDTAGGGSAPALLAALGYVLESADRIRAGYGLPDLPLVINLSYGYTGGPHDGSGWIASQIRAILDGQRSTTLILPAGNTFQSSLAGQVVPGAGDLNSDVPWQVQANDRTASPLELWFAPGADLSSLALDIIDPTGFPAAVLAPGELTDASVTYVVRNREGAVVGQIDGRTTATRRCVVIRLVPTETPPGRASAAAGLWRIRLRSAQPAALNGPIDCRLHRDFNPIGYFQGARQSYFDPGEPLIADDGTLRTIDDPDGFLRRYGTLNDLATDAAHTIVVGAAYADTGEPSFYSSAGPASSEEPAVDGLSPAETDRALAGLPGAGTRSGSVYRLAGTSVAAPLLAGRMASILSRDRKAAPAQAVSDWGPLFAAELGLRPSQEPAGPARARRGRFEAEGPPEA